MPHGRPTGERTEVIPLKDDNPSRRVPIINFLLIVANLLVFVFQFFLLPQGPAYLIKTLGFVPYELHHATAVSLRSGVPAAVTLFSAMFIHAGWLHIIGNMLYLFVFGDNVEDRLGHLRYLIFYLLCGIIAALVHAAIFPESRVPSVGASGAIAGVLAAYMICYPRARITTLIIIFFFFRIVRIPAIILLGLWIVLQVISGMTELSARAGGIAWFAHMGGFAAGLLLLLVMRPRAGSRQARDARRA